VVHDLVRRLVGEGMNGAGQRPPIGQKCRVGGECGQAQFSASKFAFQTPQLWINHTRQTRRPRAHHAAAFLSLVAAFPNVGRFSIAKGFLHGANREGFRRCGDFSGPRSACQDITSFSRSVHTVL